MDEIFALIFEETPWQAVVAVAVYGLFWSIYGDLWQQEPARKRWTGYLIQNTWSRRYRELLGGVLDGVDAHLTPEIATEGWDPREVRSAWSFSLLNLSLFGAMIYPVVFILGAWLITGEERRLGDIVVLPAPDSVLTRIVQPALLLGYVALIVLVARDRRTGLLRAVAIALVLVLPYPVAMSVLKAPSPFELGFDMSVSVLLFTGFFVALHLGAENALNLARQFFGMVWRRRTTAYIIGMILIGPSYALMPTYGEFDFGAPLNADHAATLRTIETVFDYIDSVSQVVVLFGTILPLCNAMTDFLSTGLTRYLMRRGLDGRMIWAAALDAVFAALCFFVFVVLMMILVANLDNMDGSPMLRLDAVFADIRAAPDDYVWLYLCFMTPFVPTMLHMALAVFGTVIQGWGGLRRYIVEGLAAAGKGDEVRGRWAVRALTAAMTASAMVPVLLVGWAVDSSEVLGLALLDTFEEIASVLGLI